MQQFSACKNRLSEIHRFSSTRMRCITAIWPAGPPKLSAATRAHVQNASRKVTPCAGVPAGKEAARTAVESLTSGSRFLARPVVGLPGRIPTPAIEGVVKPHRRVELGKIIPIHTRIAERGRQQSSALRRNVRPRRVGATHNRGEVEEGLGPQGELTH